MIATPRQAGSAKIAKLSCVHRANTVGMIGTRWSQPRTARVQHHLHHGRLNNFICSACYVVGPKSVVASDCPYACHVFSARRLVFRMHRSYARHPLTLTYAPSRFHRRMPRTRHHWVSRSTIPSAVSACRDASPSVHTHSKRYVVACLLGHHPYCMVVDHPPPPPVTHVVTRSSRSRDRVTAHADGVAPNTRRTPPTPHDL